MIGIRFLDIFQFYRYLAAFENTPILDFSGCHFAFDFRIDDNDFIEELKRMKCREINFSKAVFYKNFIVNEEFDYSLNFSNATFAQSVEFVGFKGKKKQKIIFWQAIFKSYVTFIDAEFHEDAIFSGAKFALSEICFENVKFGGDANFNDVEIGYKEEKGTVNFSKISHIDGDIDSSENKQIYFEKAKICSDHFNLDGCNVDNINFRNADIKSNFSLVNGDVLGDCSFYGTQFGKNVTVSHTEFGGDFNFQRIKMLDKSCTLNINETTFPNKILFSESIFYDTKIFNVTFKEEVDFYAAEFHGPLEFVNVDFKSKVVSYCTAYSGNVDFRNCNFRDTVKFVNITNVVESSPLPPFSFRLSSIEGLFMIDADPDDREANRENIHLRWESFISFEYCFFKNNSLLILRAIRGNIASLNLDYANVLGKIILQDIEMKRLTMENSTVTGAISIVDSVKFVELGGRRTALLLKNEMLKIVDRPNYIEYRKREHIILRNDLFRKFKDAKGWKKVTALYNWSLEAFVVWLNRWSNDFGIDWFRGILFTFIVAFISVTILQFNYGNIEFTLNPCEIWRYLKYFLGDVLKYLWLPNMISTDLADWEKSCWLIFVLSKILIGFGFYQTIAAFRKYGK